MTTLGDQVQRVLDIAQVQADSVSDPFDRSAIIGAIFGVWAAWDADPNPAPLAVFPSTSQCQRWATGDSSVRRVVFAVDCDSWAYGLEQAIGELSRALAEAGRPNAAEAADALSEQVDTIRTVEEEILPSGLGGAASWWGPLPGPAKIAIIAAGFWVAADTISKVR